MIIRSMIPKLPLIILLAISSHTAVVQVAHAQGEAFIQTSAACHEGFSGPNCPKQYRFTGGPGNVDQRVDYGVEMICSPSCTDNSNPKVCSLILALHGVHSNPYDQKWLMVGVAQDDETYLEDEEHGGPFCMSFHKSKGDGWEYVCGGDDEAHLEGFIHHAIDNFPIDPNAVNLHGFSSGGIQIHNMMYTHCSIESLISAASSYGSGNVATPPSTKAAYLIVHGTHDTVVPYDTVWTSTGGMPSCACNEWPASDTCTNTGYLHLYGERLAGSIATMRGYTGDVWGASLPVTSKIDLMEYNVASCNDVVNKCIDQRPNPPSYSCDDLEEMETDVIEYPIPSGSDFGRVTVWRINMQNHNYPNKRRGIYYGSTEFFFQLKKFFYENRGRSSYLGARDITQAGTGYVCSSPAWDNFSPENIYRILSGYYGPQNDWSKDECRDACLREKRCVEAFYQDFRQWGGNRACMMHYDILPCTSYQDAWWFDPVHYVATTAPTTPAPVATTPSPTVSTPAPVSSTTPAPVAAPVPPTTPAPVAAPVSPTTPAPVAAPVVPPAPSGVVPLCFEPEVLVPTNPAGHACMVNGVSVADSNYGATSTSCAAEGGEWNPYNCQAAYDYMQDQTDADLINIFRNDWWGPKCCSTPKPTAGILDVGEALLPGERVFSEDKLYLLQYQRDGNLVLYKKEAKWIAKWSTKTAGTSPGTAYMQTDGNFVVYDGDGNAIFHTDTSGNDGAYLQVQNDGKVTIRGNDHKPLLRISGQKDILDVGGSLMPGKGISSQDKRYRLQYQGDGNLVLYEKTDKWVPRWASNTAGTSPGIVYMQSDGNFVVYDADGKAIFSTNTHGNNGAYLQVQNDGNVVVYTESGSPLWDSM